MTVEARREPFVSLIRHAVACIAGFMIGLAERQ